ncbi:MAG: hypothetical protein RLZ97_593 [Verrucomicrobiota bacterium]|jgi:sodium-dependent dicarboxylate transporter 2/3/5
MNATSSLFSKKTLSLLLALIGFLLPFFLHIPGLPPAGHRLLSIFLLAVILWVTEPIPLFATSSVVILALVLFLSDMSAKLTWAWGAADGFANGAPPPYTVFMGSLANKVLILFLGGFFIAFGAAKFGVDKNLAAIVIKPFGTKPTRVLLGIMLVTAFQSMWMSNTATTATIMAVILPIIHRLDAKDKFRAALALGVPFAANIGGIGTPIGTPPNAIALGALAKINPETGEALGKCSFFQWMIFAVPVAAVLLIVAWVLLSLLFPSSNKAIVVDMDVKWEKSRNAIIYYATAIFTIGLWVTGSLHGIDSYVTGLFPVAILLSTGVVTTKDFRSLEWDVLWLVAGGVALGEGVAATGFDKWLVGLVEWNTFGPTMLGVTICGCALLMSTFISNSAATNLLAPIAVAVATAAGGEIITIVIFVALGASMAMSLPISTPPNAIAYSTGCVSTKQMATAGGLVAVIGLGLALLILHPLLKLAGVL